jgi:CHAT domain-containing protein/tetratricopeptide (TPR) repeat protein
VATAATNLAYVRSQTGDVAGAKTLYTRALHIWEKSLGSDSPKVATALQNLARLELQSGNYAEAKPLLTQALAIQEQKLGPEHPEVAGTLARLAEVEAHTATGEAFDTAVRAEGIRREHMRLTARTLPERQALAYLSTAPSAMDVMLSIAASHPSDVQTVTAAWNAVIRARGMVFDEMAARNRAASDAEDPEVAALTRTLASARQRLAAAVLRGPSDSAADRYRIAMDKVRIEKDRAERALAEKSARFREDQSRARVGFSEVASAMPSGTALVAFVKFRRHALDLTGPSSTTGADASPSYLAFVMRAGDRVPSLVRIGSVTNIDGLILQWRRQLDQEAMAGGRAGKFSEAAYRRVAGELRHQIWDPLLPHLSHSTRVFIIPDGALHLVSFAALPTGTSKYLVETGPLIHYLSAERDVLPREADSANGNGLLALGGPAFDESDTATVTSDAAFRGTRSACLDFQSVRFDPLPDSLTEVNDVVSLWNQTHLAPSEADGPRTEALRLTGAAASESAFKADAAGHRILHLATHGFFLGDSCATATGPAKIAKENPLLLSGLILAGANQRNTAAPNQEDGVLTAEEVASMNLAGVEWAVLSGCDTGAGEVKAGEGVFGLRRAFQVAGVRTVIMSLWPVEDRATRDWMRALYEGRLKNNLSTVDAVREASLHLIRQRRTKHLSTHPFYWGGFVAAGDWR